MSSLHKLAEQRIRENWNLRNRKKKRKDAVTDRSVSLDLGNCALTEVPAAVRDMIWLRSLSLSVITVESDAKWIKRRNSRNDGPKNIIRRLIPEEWSSAGSHANPFKKLQNLEELRLSDREEHWLNATKRTRCEVEELSPISVLLNLQSLHCSGARISDLSPLENMPKLHTLDASRTLVSDLSTLAKLDKLHSLYLSNAQITNITPLSGLTAMRTLDLSNNQIAELSPLAGLTKLERLNISNTRVTDFSPLFDLPALRTIELHSVLKDLSPVLPLLRADFELWDLLNSTTQLEIFDQTGCFHPVPFGGGRKIILDIDFLVHPPPEIAKQGNEAILNYFAEKNAQGVDHIYEAKLLIVGEGGAGKTSLVRRLYQPDLGLPDEHETTKGISIRRHEFEIQSGQNFRVNIWDFGGQEIYRATHQFFLTKRSLYILLDDTRKDHKNVQDDGFKYWLEAIDLLSDHSPVLIFQNEKGGRSKTIDFAGIKGRFDNVKELYRGDLSRSDSVDGLRAAIEFFVRNLPHIGEELPAKWVAIRSEIEERVAMAPHISQQEYFSIYGKHLEFDRARALHLSRYLHDLGAFLHFQDDSLLARTVILQNQWATEAVFKILDDEIVKSHLGRFTRADCERVWLDSAYSDMHPELLALMQKFELCYLLPYAHLDTWLAPQLLPPSKPATLTGWAQPGDLVLRYKYEFLPKGIVSRLMVRLHRFVTRPDLGWVTGALFERDATFAMVEISPNGGEITLRARGVEHKALLNVVSSELDALNESFQGLRDKVSKWIPCTCKVCASSPLPEFFEQKRLSQRRQDGKLTIECPGSYEDISVMQLLDGIRLQKLPQWARAETMPDMERQPAEVSDTTIRIFLASSSELRHDRDEFDLYFRQQNDSLRKLGIYLEIVRWENFLDAMSDSSSQNEYDGEIRRCDIFVCLLFTKTGKYTAREFDVAHSQFKDAGKPLIFTFFKNDDIKTGDARKDDLNSLWSFKDKLSGLGHFYTGYDSAEHLKRQFRDQLDKVIAKVRLR